MLQTFHKFGQLKLLIWKGKFGDKWDAKEVRCLVLIPLS